MQEFKKVIDLWKSSLVPSIELGALYSRSPEAHKWKATYRITVLRELLLWRVVDLLDQAYFLHLNEHGLGTRIILRCAFETAAIQTYLNIKMEAVISNELAFDEFSKLSSQLLLGSKNEMTNLTSINVLTALKHCDKTYPGILKTYHDLCESAHPNYEGVCAGYSYIDFDNFTTKFGNFWHEACGSQNLSLMHFVMQVYENEYNHYSKTFDKLEEWLIINDKRLISGVGT
jgi:hypothetical protein